MSVILPFVLYGDIGNRDFFNVHKAQWVSSDVYREMFGFFVYYSWPKHIKTFNMPGPS